MKRRHVLILWLAFHALGFGQESSVEVTQRELVDLVKRGIESNLFLQAERLEIAAREARALQAGLRANPTLMANAMKEIAGSDHFLGAGASQPLELFGRRSARREAALAQVKVARAEVSEQEEMLAGRIRDLYGEILGLQRDIAVLQQILVSNRKTHALVQARIDEGAAAKLDGTIQLTEIGKLEAREISLQGEHEGAVLELKTLLGLPPDQPLFLSGSVLHPPDIPPLQGALVEATGRADLKRVDAAERAARAEVQRATAESRWDVTVSAEYRRSDNGFHQRGFNDAGQLERVRGVFNMLMFGASFQFPLFNRNQGEILEFQTRADMEVRRRRYLELAIHNELRALYRRADTLEASRRMYERGALRLAEETLSIVRQKHDLGAISFLDVLQEQRRFLEIQTGYSEILKELFRARSGILRSLGRIT
ncbi:MAG: TolC family protein [Acidobacteriota bacterium]